MPLPSLDLYVIQRAVVNAASAGDNTIVAASGGKQIFVLYWFIIAGGTVNATWQDGASGTALTGPIPLVANTGVSTGFTPQGSILTSANTLLNLSLSGAIQVSGIVNYILV